MDNSKVEPKLSIDVQWLMRKKELGNQKFSRAVGLARESLLSYLSSLEAG